MKKSLTITVLSVIVLLTNLVSAQNFESDLKMISQHLDSASSAEISVEITMYRNKGENAVYSSSASVKKTKSASVSVIDGTEIYKNNSYATIIDHENKRVRIMAVDKIAQHTDDLNVDKLIKIVEANDKKPAYKSKLTKDADGVRTYVITGIQGINELVVSLDVQKKAFSRMTFLYDDKSSQKGAYVILQYKKFNVNDPATKVQEVDFYTRKSKGFELSPRLSGYILSTAL